MLHGTEPLLKWPGGKRWLAGDVLPIIRRRLSDTGRYFEPFAGGAALFFSLRPERAVLGDINSDLINTYSTVRDEPVAVLRALRRLRVTYEEYYRIRESRPRSAVGRAARFLYLNRTAFGGMYRVNAQGTFNVPYGGGSRTPSILWRTGILQACAAALQHTELVNADFEHLILRAAIGDVVYCDPTYTVAHDNNGFVRYNERNFSWDDQCRLACAASTAASRGATVIISNAHHRSVASLYKGWRRVLVRRKSRICPLIDARRDTAEYIFVSRGTPGDRQLGHFS